MLSGAGTQVASGDFYLKNATPLVLPLGAGGPQARFNHFSFFIANRHGPSPEFSLSGGLEGFKKVTHLGV